MLLCVGSPIIDIIVEVSKEYLEKYNLNPDAQYRATSGNKEIFPEIMDMRPKFLAGGSVTNTVRIFQAISKTPESVVYVGSIGKDNFGKIIKDNLDKESIVTYLIEKENKETGKCAVLLSEKGKWRCLVADLGASSCFNLDDFNASKMHFYLEQSEYLYISTFFLGVSTEVTKIIITYFLDHKKKVVVNLGAAVVCKKYAQEIKFMVQNADIVIGNQSEFIEFFIHSTDNDEMVSKINKIIQDYSCKSDKVFVKTNGPESVFVFKNGNIKKYSVKKLDNIVDTNGAGDAFVGGFLAKYLVNNNLDDCVLCGLKCSREIVQRLGCDLTRPLKI